jgi:hypothetical protein
MTSEGWKTTCLLVLAGGSRWQAPIREDLPMSARTARAFRELGRPRKTGRSGSRRRLQRIAFRGNWSLEAIVFFVSMLFLLLVVVPWLVQHAPTDDDSTDEPTILR